MVGGKTFLVLVLLCISSLAWAGKLTNEEYWNQTGLNFEIVKQKFQGSCYKNQKGFVACVQALNAIAARMVPPGIFALDQELAADSPFVGSLRLTYGPLKLYNYKALPNAKLATYWPKYEAARDLQIKYASELFSRGDYRDVNFAAILTDLKPKLLVGNLAGSEGLLSATLINTFLSSAVDPHTRIQPLAQIDDNSKSLDVTYIGIGATVAVSGSQFILQNPVANGPAIAAGLRANDIIVSINGEKTEKRNLSDVTMALKGQEGTTVKVGLLRKGVPLDVEVVRGKVTIPNLQTQWLSDTEIPIGYIKLSSFMEADICTIMKSAIIDFQNKGAKGLILDLRGDGGGFVNVAVCIGSLFVGKKIIVKQVDLKDNKEIKYFWSSDAITNLPLVTLIDGGSASASEILAGALQDYQRSWLVGDRSYGKASVQTQSPWSNNTGKTSSPMEKIRSWFNGGANNQIDLGETIGLWHTVSRFYQPSGRTNQIVGLTPDFPVDPFPNATADDKFVLREADLFTNALPPVGPKWTETRPDKVSAISSCMASSGLAKTIFDKKQDDAVSPDFRIISAEVVLSCDR